MFFPKYLDFKSKLSHLGMKLQEKIKHVVKSALQSKETTLQDYSQVCSAGAAEYDKTRLLIRTSPVATWRFGKHRAPGAMAGQAA